MPALAVLMTVTPDEDSSIITSKVKVSIEASTGSRRIQRTSVTIAPLLGSSLCHVFPPSVLYSVTAGAVLVALPET